MTLKTQKIISVVLISWVVVLGFQVLVYLINLNQPVIALQVAFLIYMYTVFKIFFLYDLHFKKGGALGRARQKHSLISNSLKRNLQIFYSALLDRFHHLRQWKYLRNFHNYLLLPGLIFWTTLTILYLNLGQLFIQQLFVSVSSLALIITFWYLKDIFYKKEETVRHEAFITLSLVKIYTSLLVFVATLGITRHFCLEPKIYLLGIFGLTFSLIYQALFQHNLINGKTLGLTFVISIVLTSVSYFVLIFWGFNYFTAGVFLMAVYNLLWGIFHQYLDGTLNWTVVLELLLLTVLVCAMVISVTNFRARLLDFC